LRKGELKGKKLGKHCIITKENLKAFLNDEDGGDGKESKRKGKKRKKT
jgi:hypothetical protein